MIVRALIAAVLALAALLGLQTLRLSNERTDHQTTKTQAAEDRAAYDRERARVAVAFGKSVTDSLAAQQALSDQFIQAQEEKHAQVTAARADADRLRARLRAQQPQARPAAADVPGTAEAAATTSAALGPGEVFPSGTGDDLVSLALRAEEIRADAQACRRRYEAARSANEALNVNHEKAAIQARDQP